MATAACAIKPELFELSVLLCKFIKLRSVVLVVLGGVAVTGLVTIPRRKIDSELHSMFAGGLFHPANNVCFAVLERAALHAVIGLRRRPKTESVMMLGNENHIADARGLECPHPLVRIELRRIEYLWGCRAIAP